MRLDSPGPVLFRQRRVGLNGREFTLYKFRSMRVGAEDELHALQAHNEADGPVFKMREDPRVTGVGRFIRRISIDELPQLWNVFRGEMSVVGPRPPIAGRGAPLPALAAPPPLDEARDHLHLAGLRPLRPRVRPLDGARPRVHRQLVALGRPADCRADDPRRAAPARRALTRWRAGGYPPRRAAPPDLDARVAAAADVLRRGGLVAYPTETFYGLGALARDAAALDRLARAKLRPEGKPLPLLAADLAQVKRGRRGWRVSPPGSPPGSGPGR